MLLEISAAGSPTYSFRACSGVLPGRLPDTTTIALIARAAKRGAPSARPDGHGVFPATQSCLPVEKISPLFSAHLRWRLACHFLCRRTLGDREATMIAMLNFATLVFTTLFAAAAAVAFHWMLLRAMFVLMRPATARRVNAPTPLVRGAVELARAYAPQR